MERPGWTGWSGFGGIWGGSLGPGERLWRDLLLWRGRDGRVGAGLEAFGSRVDIFLSKNCKLKVNVGDKVKGGITIIA